MTLSRGSFPFPLRKRAFAVGGSECFSAFFFRPFALPSRLKEDRAGLVSILADESDEVDDSLSVDGVRWGLGRGVLPGWVLPFPFVSGRFMCEISRLVTGSGDCRPPIVSMGASYSSRPRRGRTTTGAALTLPARRCCRRRACQSSISRCSTARLSKTSFSESRTRGIAPGQCQHPERHGAGYAAYLEFCNSTWLPRDRPLR